MIKLQIYVLNYFCANNNIITPIIANSIPNNILNQCFLKSISLNIIIPTTIVHTAFNCTIVNAIEPGWIS